MNVEGRKSQFSCPGQYINIAKETGNSEQGDLYEGVFAWLKSRSEDRAMPREAWGGFENYT